MPRSRTLCDYCNAWVSRQSLMRHVARCAAHLGDDEPPRRLTAVTASGSGSSSGDYERNVLIAELIGRVEVGVADIDVAAPLLAQPCSDASVCVVCLDALASKPKLRRTRCGHTYCAGCIERWLRSHRCCPVCNAEHA